MGEPLIDPAIRLQLRDPARPRVLDLPARPAGLLRHTSDQLRDRTERVVGVGGCSGSVGAGPTQALPLDGFDSPAVVVFEAVVASA